MNAVPYHITHRTEYRYQRNVSVSHHLLHLRPSDTPHQKVLHYSLKVRPEPEEQVDHVDCFGNITTHLSLETPHRQLIVTSESHLEITPRPSSISELAISPPWEEARRLSESDFYNPSSAAAQFGHDSTYIRRHAMFAEFAAESFPRGMSVLHGAASLCGRIFKLFKFDSKATTVATPVEEVLQKRAGVCQDFAHLAIACFRSLGLPAQYVSGYIETQPPAGKARLAGADASHAWVAVWCPANGWVEFDPTNNLLVNDKHAKIGVGRDFADITPIRGVIVSGGDHTLRVAVDVRRSDLQSATPPSQPVPVESPEDGEITTQAP